LSDITKVNTLDYQKSSVYTYFFTLYKSTTSNNFYRAMLAQNAVMRQ